MQAESATEMNGKSAAPHIRKHSTWFSGGTKTEPRILIFKPVTKLQPGLRQASSPERIGERAHWRRRTQADESTADLVIDALTTSMKLPVSIGYWNNQWYDMLNVTLTRRMSAFCT